MPEPPSPSYVRTLAPWIGLSVVVVVVITAVTAWAGALNKPAEPPLPDPAAVARALGPLPTTTPEPTEESSTAPTKPAQGTKKPVPPAAKKTTAPPTVAKTTKPPAPTTEKPEPTTKKPTSAPKTTKKQNCGILGCSNPDD
ncbi:hypothetical protein [Pseudonocardia sp. TRM90224]|uniref:hypothetical protein n=1 Tax=Pseudonocardia sp. TRM90224 TaxID=2812678 RepID=UPI001E52AB89|nr:hypothetical protein [Pseudonocardia sp. TRM90224]